MRGVGLDKSLRSNEQPSVLVRKTLVIVSVAEADVIHLGMGSEGVIDLDAFWILH